jgi:uncharacterized membrane-anchored protein
MEIADGVTRERMDAYAFSTENSGEVMYEWTSAGFVPADDWGEVDADAFLAQIKAKDAAANQVRASKGMPSLTTVGWRQKPIFNPDTHTASWIIEGIDSNDRRVLNSVALKLGRYGYETITWIDDANSNNSAAGFGMAQSTHQFKAGHRYTDYVQGSDRAAEYGIAGLVAGVMAVKLMKVAGFTALLFGLKKFAFVLLLPFFWLGRKVTGVFGPKTEGPSGRPPHSLRTGTHLLSARTTWRCGIAPIVAAEPQQLALDLQPSAGL